MAARIRAVSDDGGVLYIRSVPADVLAGLDAWVAELKEERPGFGGITRTDLARDLIARAVKARAKGKDVP